LVQLNNKKLKHFNNSVFFVDLNNKNLPNENYLKEPSYNIFEWYRANYNYVKTIYHNLEKFKNIKYNIFETNIYYNNLIPYLKFKKLITLFFYSLLLFFYSLFTLFIGKWWNAIILKDKFTYLIFKYADDIMLSNDYLFSNSSINYRPLWTYVLESRNKNIIMYFYSVSDQPLCPSLNTSTFNINFPNINWPIYYCWDKFQSNQIKQLKYSKNSKFYEFGSIYFESNHKNLPKLPNKFIAVFDFEPHKTEFYVGYGTYYDLGYNFNKEISNRLLSDVIEIADKLNIKVIHKAKRDIGSKRTKSYSELLNNLTKYKNYISLNPSYNAYSIIQKSTIVISQPFTSTALMSKSVNKNSIYYDPLALINKFDPAKRDIVIIQSKKNLYNYIKNNY